MTLEARQRAESLDVETAERRRSVFGDIERQKADLAYWKKMIDYTGIKVE